MKLSDMGLLACFVAMSPITVLASDAKPISESTVAPEASAEAVSDRTNKYRTIALPFYDPTIKAGVSVIPIYAFYPDDNDLVSDASTIALPLIYTNNDSYVAKVSGDLILFEDTFRASFETGFTSTNMQLSGIDSNREMKDFTADFMFKVMEDFYLGVGAIFTSTRYTADNPEEQDGLTDVGYESDYQNDTGYRLLMQWDTREHFYYPHNGFSWILRYEDHTEWLGNDDDSTYSSIFTDYRYFYSINDNPNHIIATKVVGRYLIDADNAPSAAFTTYGRQGREVQRGFAVGDYIASNMVNLEVEYRHKFTDTGNEYFDKSAVVLIGSAGKSYGEQLTGNTEDFRDSDWLSAIGVGYRYSILPFERLNIKVDVIFNSDSETIAYFGFGESI
ncbi:hypothetical protein [Shewanella youngdeokensis]|uniref:Bacterial surface antigen (D15) domain-containing protein n=1 Tax=Shewanella youngdeokensis TaxID=2999068 RepID=A0ABZ0JVC9_9GAMM|nr:hypothetical protein RGE70_12380 [Shewanella sp. DAU334]